MSLELKSANGSILLSSEDGIGQAQVTLPRGGFLGDSGYQWVDETANRVFGTTYTNTNGKPISISVRKVYSGTDVLTVYIDGVDVMVNTPASNDTTSLVCIIPINSTYSVSSSGTNALGKWLELK